MWKDPVSSCVVVSSRLCRRERGLWVAGVTAAQRRSCSFSVSSDESVCEEVLKCFSGLLEKTHYPASFLIGSFILKCMSESSVVMWPSLRRASEILTSASLWEEIKEGIEVTSRNTDWRRETSVCVWIESERQCQCDSRSSRIITQLRLCDLWPLDPQASDELCW